MGRRASERESVEAKQSNWQFLSQIEKHLQAEASRGLESTSSTVPCTCCTLYLLQAEDKGQRAAGTGNRIKQMTDRQVICALITLISSLKWWEGLNISLEGRHSSSFRWLVLFSVNTRFHMFLNFFRGSNTSSRLFMFTKVKVQ